MLTRKQKELLLLIRDRMEVDGVPPSFDEMKVALGLRSKSGIHRLISGLEERGFIKRLPHRARALEIVRLPESMETRTPQIEPILAAPPTQKRAANVRSFTPPASSQVVPLAMATVRLPLYGRIAAGTPIEALRDPSRHIEVPAGLLAGRALGRSAGADDHYALEVSGDSMIEAGILDGDRVLIQTCDTAENGAIVVALVDNSEATLKYIERRGHDIALIPANKNYQTVLFPASHVRVQGRLVGLLRRY